MDVWEEWHSLGEHCESLMNEIVEPWVLISWSAWKTAEADELFKSQDLASSGRNSLSKVSKTSDFQAPQPKRWLV